MVKVHALATALILAATGLAHPGEHHDAAKRRRDLNHSDLGARNAEAVVAKCQGGHMAQTMAKRAALRRAMKAAELREKRDIEHTGMRAKRDQDALDQYLKTCHDRGDSVDWDKQTPHSTIFGGNATVGLAPETIIGPYWVGGEFIRSNLVEQQGGIPIHIDLQFVDSSTCAPVPNMLVDVWHANATGVYSGVVAGAGLNSTFLRGVQLTDIEGVVNFDSVFPGHYFGRVNHIHVTSNRGAKLQDNGTYTGGKVNHIGQLYFDQELINAVEGMHPYTSNAMRLTYNSQDFLVAQEASRDYDPFFDYVMLSEDPADGLLLWATIGINGTADQSQFVSPGAWYYRDGGVDTSPKWNFSGPPPGGMPGGGMPSGMPTPTGPFSMPPGMPTGFPGGFPFPTGAPADSKPFWGPCINKKKRDVEGR
ncbi:Intradiol ring-cleavage dioxygenase [Xylariaceae sp. FL0016]|nr:Intradiol ring-cleavage dioxygenase [Xylariaceae sp. FL0016]